MKTWLRYLLIIIILFCAGAGGLATSFYYFNKDKNTVENIKDDDIGSSDTTLIQTFHYPAAFSKALKGDPHAGAKIFKAYCQSCHIDKSIIPIDAPRIGFKQDWEARRKIGINALLQLTLNGFGRMPSRGGCFECTDAQIKKAVQYILDNSK